MYVISYKNYVTVKSNNKSKMENAIPLLLYSAKVWNYIVVMGDSIMTKIHLYGIKSKKEYRSIIFHMFLSIMFFFHVMANGIHHTYSDTHHLK